MLLNQFLEEFIQQSLLPLVIPINYDTLKLLKEEERKIVLDLVEDVEEDKIKNLIKLLKEGAGANRDLIFAYVGFKRWEELRKHSGLKRRQHYQNWLFGMEMKNIYQLLGQKTFRRTTRRPKFQSSSKDTEKEEL